MNHYESRPDKYTGTSQSKSAIKRVAERGAFHVVCHDCAFERVVKTGVFNDYRHARSLASWHRFKTGHAVEFALVGRDDDALDETWNVVCHTCANEGRLESGAVVDSEIEAARWYAEHYEDTMHENVEYRRIDR